MGDTYRSFYSDGYQNDDLSFITGSATVTQFPNLHGMLFRLKAWSTNIGSFFYGNQSGTNLQPYEVDAGDDTGWFKIQEDNLNNFFYYNPSGSSERMAVWRQY